MFEQAYLAELVEYEDRTPPETGSVLKVRSRSPRSAPFVPSMPLMQIRDEQSAASKADHAANVAFGNVWPGLAAACC